MRDPRGAALVVVLVLGLVASIWSLGRRGIPTRRQRIFRLVITGLMLAALALVWGGTHR